MSKRVYKSVFRAVTELEDARPFQFVKPDTFFAEKSRERMKNCVFARRGVSRELFPSLNSPPVPYAPRHWAIRNGVFIFKDQTTFPSSRNKSFSRAFRTSAILEFDIFLKCFSSRILSYPTINHELLEYNLMYWKKEKECRSDWLIWGKETPIFIFVAHILIQRILSM